MVTIISKGKPHTFAKRERVDAISDAAALHQQHAALATEPGPRQDADTFLLGGKHGRLHVMLGLTQFDQSCVARVRDVCDVTDIELAQLFEDQIRPILRIRGCNCVASNGIRPTVCRPCHRCPFEQATVGEWRSSALTCVGPHAAYSPSHNRLLAMAARLAQWPGAFDSPTPIFICP
jgi:hypothetical protein